ncbi:MAG: zf-HC2 domain-containing protein [Clostridia bacterium]|nr:zf-HC2 domain-containing protein [Clostridia bacterium]
MKCDVIRDLIPLYIDDCCSEESRAIVKEHLEKCPDCNSLFEEMKAPTIAKPIVPAPKKLKSLNSWKASILQSVLLFVSFALITIGVFLEVATSFSDATNGNWAFYLVIPTTGFMLSLANWYFVRFYKSKKAFSNFSWLATLGITVVADVWAIFHYEIDISEIFVEFTNMSTTDFFEALLVFAFLALPNILITTFFCALSKFTSYKYATMLGKE